MKYLLNASLVALIATGAALAHGGAEHVTGFARTITADSVTVETTKHTMVTIMLTPKTEVKKSEVKAAMSDLKVGDRVVIHAEKNKAGKLEAEEVEFGPTPARK
jgi:hypothetical protein